MQKEVAAFEGIGECGAISVAERIGDAIDSGGRGRFIDIDVPGGGFDAGIGEDVVGIAAGSDKSPLLLIGRSGGRSCPVACFAKPEAGRFGRVGFDR